MTVDIDIAVEVAPWSGLAGLEALVRRSVEAAAAEAGLDTAAESELSVLLSDDAAIRVLNRDWRGQDKPTNVLSFPADAAPPGGPRLLGDIAIAYETVVREAADDGKTVADHLAHLLVHGFLHLLGHDHEDGAEAAAMEAMEARVMARLGLADPYAGTDPVLADAP